MSIVKDSITIFPKMKRGTAENVAQISWVTPAGVL